MKTCSLLSRRALRARGIAQFLRLLADSEGGRWGRYQPPARQPAPHHEPVMVSVADMGISSLIKARIGLKTEEEGRCARDIVLSYYVMSLRHLTD